MRDRDVLIVAALVIASVVVVARLTGLFPPLDDAVGLAPVVIGVLVVATVVVLLTSLRRR